MYGHYLCANIVGRLYLSGSALGMLTPMLSVGSYQNSQRGPSPNYQRPLLKGGILEGAYHSSFNVCAGNVCPVLRQQWVKAHLLCVPNKVVPPIFESLPVSFVLPL